jgi:hypothetical protein
MMTAGDILDVLDRGAESYAVPMLDNGYLYLAATRMALYRSNVDWAIVFRGFRLLASCRPAIRLCIYVGKSACDGAS